MSNANPAPGRVLFLEGRGDLPMIEMTSAWSTAEIYPHGAHVTHFQKTNEPPLLFLSQCSRFDERQPIRGGIPVIFPWFGPREGLPQHGFARLKTWDLKEVVPASDGGVSVRFGLPDSPEAGTLPAHRVEYLVTVNQTLRLELNVRNASDSEELAFESCLHTYFEVGDIGAVTVVGLKGTEYLDKVADYARRTENDPVIRVSSEIDRTYLATQETVAIEDTRLKRRIRVNKQGSASTVVWNPWIAKSQQMPDFGNDEYLRMICVESGNVATDQIKLRPGQSASLVVELSTEAL